MQVPFKQLWLQQSDAFVHEVPSLAQLEAAHAPPVHTVLQHSLPVVHGEPTWSHAGAVHSPFTHELLQQSLGPLHAWFWSLQEGFAQIPAVHSFEQHCPYDVHCAPPARQRADSMSLLDAVVLFLFPPLLQPAKIESTITRTEARMPSAGLVMLSSSTATRVPLPSSDCFRILTHDQRAGEWISTMKPKGGMCASRGLRTNR
jgi:hypothetical protein